MSVSNTCLDHRPKKLLDQEAAGSPKELAGSCLPLGSSRNLKSHKRINEKLELIDRKCLCNHQSLKESNHVAMTSSIFISPNLFSSL